MPDPIAAALALAHDAADDAADAYRDTTEAIDRVREAKGSHARAAAAHAVYRAARAARGAADTARNAARAVERLGGPSARHAATVAASAAESSATVAEWLAQDVLAYLGAIPRPTDEPRPPDPAHLNGRHAYRGAYIEDEAGDRWWSADLLASVERDRDALRAEVSALRAEVGRLRAATPTPPPGPEAQAPTDEALS